MVALWWLKNYGDWSVFVTNRVNEINSLVSSQFWRHVSVEEEIPWYAITFSNFHSIFRFVSWILRFVKDVTKKREFRVIEELAVHEIEHAEKSLIKIVQAKFFPSEDSFPNMNVITNEEGVKRVKTRITEWSDNLEFIYPIILPGSELVSLPSDRVNVAAVFEVVSVDLAGPLYVKGGQKSWIVLFTCPTYRALHLGLTSSLSTEAFLWPLRRFIARRGRPRVIHSDNGTNFRGTQGELSGIDWEKS
ncbi:integrase catalytic domain-containing protein [Trichonephila clavipes]|uniref:Integrase catalytic domain-containing protein n=1 Tax=Trichonephila clavipes TaxID=2585209 RepID=A0A8X6SLX6_TRICX|nr:integrase catalytic domain-containing protein [Trichonephila clavipes]